MFFIQVLMFQFSILDFPFQFTRLLQFIFGHNIPLHFLHEKKMIFVSYDMSIDALNLNFFLKKTGCKKNEIINNIDNLNHQRNHSFHQ